MTKKLKKCIIVGHYPYELQGKGEENHTESFEIKDKLRKKIIELVEDGTTYFYCGMDLGVELWAGEILLDLKKDFPEITIHSVIASEERANDWSEEDRKRYFDEVLPNCDHETYMSVKNDQEAIPYRNKIVSAQASFCLAVWNGSDLTDTADLIRKMKARKKDVIVIDI